MAGGAPYGAIIGAVQDTLGGIAQTAVNAQFADQSWKRQRKVLQNQITWKVNDLRRAGLNPILAAGSALAGGAPGVATPQSADFRTSGSVSNAAKAALDREQADRVESEIDANNARSGLDRASSMLAGEKKKTEAEARKLLREQQDQARAQTANLDEQARVNAARGDIESAIADMWRDPVMRKAMQAKEFAKDIIPNFGFLGRLPFLTGKDVAEEEEPTTKKGKKPKLHNYFPRKR